MFTGLIEEIGTLEAAQFAGDSGRLVVACKMAPDLSLGESVAVNGACLSVEKTDARSFTAFTSRETLERTTLKGAKPGQRLNLERALRLGDRLGGHMVAGHVDAVGRFEGLDPVDEGYWLRVAAPASILEVSIPKGSIAVDGISLTLVDVASSRFTVAVIPQTWTDTNLRFLKPGDPVNLESDMIGKYVARLMAGPRSRVSAFPKGSVWELTGQ